jgi:DNA (cytosine-5)-methyltransferase 1
MVKYSCEKCGKEFTQKGHYTKHTTKKNPCVFESKIEEMIEKVVAKKINELSSITLNTNTDKKYSVLSLFTGIGGMDMGFGGDVIVHKNSISIDFVNNIKCKYEDIDGFVNLIPKMFNVVFQNDILEGAKKVCELNNTHSNYIVKSIYELLSENYNFPKTDIVIGGFPCNDFSHAGKRKGFNSETTHNLKDELTIDNSRGTLYKSFVSVVDKVKPKIFIAENVYGLLTMKDKPINQIISDFSNLGYDVNYELIKANEYGIPQKRWRVIIIGISKNRRINELNINWNLITKNKINCNIGVYFNHLLEPSDTTDISQQSFSKAKKLEKGQGQVEINLNSISPTIRAEHHGNIEFRRHLNGINTNEKELPERRLTIRETGLIQTFPPKFIFNQKKDMTSYKYIGNAVPPLLAYIVADKIEELLLEYF